MRKILICGEVGGKSAKRRAQNYYVVIKMSLCILGYRKKRLAFCLRRNLDS